MTNNEAIEHIKSAAKLAIDAGYSSDIVDACALAVRALGQEVKTDEPVHKELPWESGKIIVPLPEPCEVSEFDKDHIWYKGWQYISLRRFAEAKKEAKTDILDKIKAELLATAEMHEDGDYYLRDKWVSEIIDKYRQEG